MEYTTEQFIARRFLSKGDVINVYRLGNGLINDTFLVTTNSAAVPRFVLQRINAEVFPFPDRVMANLERLSDHLAVRPHDPGRSADAHEFRLPSLLSTVDGKNCYVGESGDYWRALTYIENSQPLDRLESAADAVQVGLTLGRFHQRVSSMDPRIMEDSLPGFHATPLYLYHYDRLAVSGARNRLLPSRADLRFCEEFINSRRELASVLKQARQDGRLSVQIIHGDPKLNNFLFDTQTRKAIAMIDLDTVKSGLIHHDIGDCLRSCCNQAGETANSVQSPEFELDLCEPILAGYFRECGALLTQSDVGSLYDAIRLLPFELGLRFLADYLDGDRYFKVDFPGHNLVRAVGQFKLVRSVENQEREIRGLVRKLACNRNATQAGSGNDGPD